MPHSVERINRPALLLHGGGGENTPADREALYRPANLGREEKS